MFTIRIAITHSKLSHSLQKIFSRAKVAKASPVRDCITSLWTTVLERGLGLIPINDVTRADEQQTADAFEIIRVSPAPSSPLLKFTPSKVRNRFACADPVGGYRDINFKIRVGFKSDPKTGRPLFCPMCARLRCSERNWLIVIQETLARI